MAKNNKTRFFYVLYCDKTWVFDQSERAYDPIYIKNIFKVIAFLREQEETRVLVTLITGQQDGSNTPIHNHTY